MTIVKANLAAVAFWLMLAGCSGNKHPAAADTGHVYPTVSYLNIKLDASGHLPTNPYILEYRNGKKQIIFCGTNHLERSDTGNKMYKIIEKKFFEVHPDICVNEGGDVSHKKYPSKIAAILKNREIGLIKVLSDSLGVHCINGDMTDSLEFKGLLKKYSKGEFLAYIVTERFMWSFPETMGKDSAGLNELYKKFIEGYIMKEGGVKLKPEEQTLAFYKASYENILKRPFSLETLEPTNPFDPKGKFQEIGRRSKELRDQALLKKIDDLLDHYDKVFIVFGGWHLLTCEPGLREVIMKKR
jgi:hypothetical protein